MLSKEQIDGIWETFAGDDGFVRQTQRMEFAQAIEVALRAQADARPVAWLSLCTKGPKVGQVEVAEPNGKSSNPEYWTDAFQVYTHPEASAPGLSDAYDEGFTEAANWADRDDLVADMDSPAYKACRTEFLTRASAATVDEPSDMRDAYVGAREDMEIWKRRALEAEELNRKFIASINGPTHVGEPVVLTFTPVESGLPKRKYPIEYKGVAAQQQAEPGADEWAAMQQAFEESDFYFKGESPAERTANWRVWIAAWCAAQSGQRASVVEGWDSSVYGYQDYFNAISAATRICGDAIAVSVSDFHAAMRRATPIDAAPTQQQEGGS